MGVLNVGSLQGNFPNYRITLSNDSELDIASQLLLTNQTYVPLPANTTDGFASTAGGPRGYVKGQLRYNTTTQKPELYDGVNWIEKD